MEYAVEWVAHNIPRRLPAGARRNLWVRIRNQGEFVWQSPAGDGERIDLVVRFDGEIHCMSPIRGPVGPGGEAILEVPVKFPLSPARCCVRLELLRQNVAWFCDRGAIPVEAEVELTAGESSLTHEQIESTWPANRWNYQPGYGAWWSASGRHYPQFVKEAKGCLFWDADGREFVDYTMGWGSVLLGHAHPRLCQAIGRAVARGNMMSLPHLEEMELTRLLCQRIPSAEGVLFGKNGSDVTTAAVRMARVFTGRRQVVFSGYHGWQDWNNGSEESHRFPTNDLDALEQLLHRHRGELAAVVIEPAAQVEGVDGPIRGADREFLFAAAELARSAGALLIFDEIFTGFRYPGGSVQQAIGLAPDLTCLGKALSSGMALSAVVGRRDVFDRAADSIHYHPTFKGEACAFASAIEALAIYDENDVPGAVWRCGERLAAGINRAALESGIRGGIVGVPFRMVFRFDEDQPLRRSLLRTLLEQELLQRGIFTFRGCMIPSSAHDEDATDRTIQAFTRALEKVAQANHKDDIIHRIELPGIW